MPRTITGRGWISATVPCLCVAAALLAGCVVDQGKEVQTYRDVLDGNRPRPVSYTHLDVYKRQMLISLSGTLQQNPNFWEDTKTGVQYSVLVQTPQYTIDSINALENQPVIPSSMLVPGQAFDPTAQLLGSIASLDRGASPSNITHYNPKPTYDVLAGVRGMDLNSVAQGVRKIVAKENKDLPKGTRISIRGQVQSMTESFEGLSFGLIFAIILVYLLMVINFQSWLDPLIILMALPGAIAGILWMLYVTQTTICLLYTSHLLDRANDWRGEGG